MFGGGRVPNHWTFSIIVGSWISYFPAHLDLPFFCHPVALVAKCDARGLRNCQYFDGDCGGFYAVPERLLWVDKSPGCLYGAWRTKERVITSLSLHSLAL